jgi:type III restriction enzyme
LRSRTWHNGQPHDYQPDFLVRLAGDAPLALILEIKGYDPLADTKAAAAQRWVAAVNAGVGRVSWAYALVRDPAAIPRILDSLTAAKG